MKLPFPSLSKAWLGWWHQKDCPTWVQRITSRRHVRGWALPWQADKRSWGAAAPTTWGPHSHSEKGDPWFFFYPNNTNRRELDTYTEAGKFIHLRLFAFCPEKCSTLYKVKVNYKNIQWWREMQPLALCGPKPHKLQREAHSLCRGKPARGREKGST